MLIKRVALIVVASALALIMAMPVALAEERTCRGTLGARTVDNLRVPQGATCTLNGTIVKGTVNVENRDKLYANGVRVIGKIQSEDFQTAVGREGWRVAGNAQLHNDLSE